MNSHVFTHETDASNLENIKENGLSDEWDHGAFFNIGNGGYNGYGSSLITAKINLEDDEIFFVDDADDEVAKFSGDLADDQSKWCDEHGYSAWPETSSGQMVVLDLDAIEIIKLELKNK